MPIYEYYCEDTECNHNFEEVLSMSRRDEPLKKPCPECGKKTIKKGVSATTMGADLNYTRYNCGDWSRLMDKVKKATPQTSRSFRLISDNRGVISVLDSLRYASLNLLLALFNIT